MSNKKQCGPHLNRTFFRVPPLSRESVRPAAVRRRRSNRLSAVEMPLGGREAASAAVTATGVRAPASGRLARSAALLRSGYPRRRPSARPSVPYLTDSFGVRIFSEEVGLCPFDQVAGRSTLADRRSSAADAAGSSCRRRRRRRGEFRRHAPAQLSVRGLTNKVTNDVANVEEVKINELAIRTRR